MGKRSKDILYFPLYALFCVLSWLPLSALYVVSRLLYYIVYYVVRYRRKVTRDNMAKAFPDKSDAELSQMERDFYRYFTDYMVETIKLHTDRYRGSQAKIRIGTGPAVEESAPAEGQ